MRETHTLSLFIAHPHSKSTINKQKGVKRAMGFLSNIFSKFKKSDKSAPNPAETLHSEALVLEQTEMYGEAYEKYFVAAELNRGGIQGR